MKITVQADVGGVDAEILHQVQQADLLIDGRGLHGGRLQAVAQRLVVQHDAARGHLAGVIPVVDERVAEHQLRI